MPPPPHPHPPPPPPSTPPLPTYRERERESIEFKRPTTGKSNCQIGVDAKSFPRTKKKKKKKKKKDRDRQTERVEGRGGEKEIKGSLAVGVNFTLVTENGRQT